ncbi:MAG: VUT family protein [Proteobacteria bacterium]|nr:VUT family protein [Pseudomonadota bacterium]
MILFSKLFPKPSYLSLSVAMLVCLILLLCLSLKIVVVQGVIFTASSVFIAITAACYFTVLRKCNFTEQRHLLNQSLLALYLFSIGLYFLMSVSTIETSHENSAYQIVFEGIARKFFAAAISFALSFYLPHILFCNPRGNSPLSYMKCLTLSLLGGFSFFSLDYFFLFYTMELPEFYGIYFDSLLAFIFIYLLARICYHSLSYIKGFDRFLSSSEPDKIYLTNPFYQYLVIFSVIILLICLSCEYRLISISNGWLFATSGLLFPLAMFASNLISELYGYRANLRLAAILIISQICFDLFLIKIVSLPTPQSMDFSSLHYSSVVMRLPAGALALFVTFVGNAILLENLKYTRLGIKQGLRIIIANFFSTSVLCLVNYSLLYGGVYPHQQISSLAFNTWFYKFSFILAALPLTLWIYHFLKKNSSFQFVSPITSQR